MCTNTRRILQVIAASTLMASTLIVNLAQAGEYRVENGCRLDWNGDAYVDQADYLDSDPMGGYYAEWYIFRYYPSYFPILFPDRVSADLDYIVNGKVDHDDLMGPLDAANDTEGFYVAWYIYSYYPSYDPIFMPEYSCDDAVCPLNPDSCPAGYSFNGTECENGTGDIVPAASYCAHELDIFGCPAGYEIKENRMSLGYAACEPAGLACCLPIDEPGEYCDDVAGYFCTNFPSGCSPSQPSIDYECFNPSQVCCGP